MKTLSTILLLLVCQQLIAQNDSNQHRFDFSKINPYEVHTDRLKKRIDSLVSTSKLDSLSQLYNYALYNRYTGKYVSIFIGYESGFSSLTNLNTGLMNNGFKPFSENVPTIPFGIDIKGKRWLFTYLINIATNNTTKAAGYSVKLSNFGASLGFGYNILNLRRLQLYPQVALGLQSFEIDVTRDAAAKDIVNMNGFLLANAETTFAQANFVVNYALEADYHLVYSEHSGGIILAVRYGGSSNIVEGDFKINKQKSDFKLNDQLRKSYLSVALKFYFKTPEGIK